MLTFIKQRKELVIFIFILVFVGGYVATSFIDGSGGVPEEFSNARMQGALIAQGIVTLSSETAQDIKRIGEMESTGAFPQARELTSQAVTRSREIRDRAMLLSQEVEKMTRSLDSIQPPQARQAALEAITSWLTLISRLINYSGELGQLLDELNRRLSGAPQDHRISSLIEEINAEARAINSFNDQARQAIERFDKFLREQAG